MRANTKHSSPILQKGGLACALILLAACSGKPEKTAAPIFVGEEQVVDAIQHYDLEEIQKAGTLIGGTLSGPDTYYEYHGREMGLQFDLAEAFAASIGVRLRMEVAQDTASLKQMLHDGDIDFIALEMPRWLTRSDEPHLKEAISQWWRPERAKELQAAGRQTVTVRRRVRPVMQDAAHGIISAWDDLFRRHCGTAGWDWRLIAAQCYQESGFDPNAVSSVGAQGLLQLMPATAAAMGVPEGKAFDPEQNISAATRYLRKIQGFFSDIPDPTERIRFTLAAYNGGVGHVQDAQTLARKHGSDPKHWDEVAPFILRLAEPAYYRDPDVKHGYMRGSETEGYVRLIMDRWQQYRTAARPYAGGSTPAPSRRNMEGGEYKSNVKPPEEWVP